MKIYINRLFLFILLLCKIKKVYDYDFYNNEKTEGLNIFNIS